MHKDKKGQTALEYVVICVVLLGIAVSTMAQPLRDALNLVFSNVKTEISN